MSKNNNVRSGCRDVFHAYLVENAQFAGGYDFPVLKPVFSIPRKVIRFSEALLEKQDFDQWIVFYEDDFLFERVWNNPKKYLNCFRRFEGVVTPDFSLYVDMPLALQIWNIYRSRAIGAWLQQNGIKVIPNIRFGAPETYQFVCDGISKHSVIFIGSLGCIKNSIYRKEFEKGLDTIVEMLKPETILIYGSCPSNTSALKKQGINVVMYSPNQYRSEKGVD